MNKKLVITSAFTMQCIQQRFFDVYNKSFQSGIGATKSFIREINREFDLSISTVALKSLNTNIYRWIAQDSFNIGHASSFYKLLKGLNEQEFIQRMDKVLNHVVEAYKLNEPKKEALVEMKDVVDAEEKPDYKQEILNEKIKTEKMETPTEVKHENKQTEAKFMLNFDLSTIVDSAVHEYIENSEVIKNIQKYIRAEAQKLQPSIVQFGEIKKPGIVKGRLHSSFKQTVRLAESERNVWLSGPAGTGKTTLAKQVSEALGLEFGFIACSQGMGEGHLLGRMTAHGDYLPSRFVEVFENGGLYLFDEIDAADANTLIVLNSALANGTLSVPSRVSKPYAERHPDFICIAAANTWGSGSVDYSARGIIDQATKDRFCGAKVYVDYDRKLEKEICGDDLKNEVDKLHQIRRNLADQKIRKVLSTRLFVSMARQLNSGIEFKDFIDIYMLDWTNEEKAKGLMNVTL